MTFVSFLQAILTNPALKEPKKFTFDRCYWSTNKADAHYAPQELLYSDLGVSVLNNAFAGYNTCLMAYGQTSAGKTYTMMGAEGDPGLIPRLCADLFARIASCEGKCTDLVRLACLAGWRLPIARRLYKKGSIFIL